MVSSGWGGRGSGHRTRAASHWPLCSSPSLLARPSTEQMLPRVLMDGLEVQAGAGRGSSQTSSRGLWASSDGRRGASGGVRLESSGAAAQLDGASETPRTNRTTELRQLHLQGPASPLSSWLSKRSLKKLTLKCVKREYETDCVQLFFQTYTKR